MAASSSAARIEANRLNAQRSTGPRTVEGKARSRANAVKHGLTGAGLALPGEDAAVVEARFLDLQEELAPATLEGALLVHLAALMSVRIERARRQETATLAMICRHAAEEFDLARLDEIDHLFDTIETNPRDHHRRLLQSTEGVDLLLNALQGVRAQVELGLFRQWTTNDQAKVACFLGSAGLRFPTARADAVLNALRGDLSLIAPVEQAQIPSGDAGERHWSAELTRLIDAEHARLVAVRATIDPAIVAADRREAADRATLNPSPDAILAKKYEAAAINNLVRALRDFHKLEHAEAETDPPQDQAKPIVAAIASPSVPEVELAPPVAPAPIANEAKPVTAPLLNEAKPAVEREPVAPRIGGELPPSRGVPVFHTRQY